MRRLVSWLWRPLHRHHDLDAGLHEEIRQHLERRAGDLVRAGLAPDEAARQARVEFGRLEAYKAEVRDIAGPPRPIARIFECGRALQYAARRLRRAPVFTTFAVLSMAIGLGVTTAFYAFMHVVLWPTSGLTDPARLVQLSGRSAAGGDTIVYGGYTAIAREDFEQFRAAQSTMASVGAWTTFSQPFVAGNVAERFFGEAVSGGTFAMLGVRMAFGRAITADDELEDAEPVIVLAYAFWKRHFYGDPSVVGRVVRLGQLDCRIIGVAPKAFSTAGRPEFEGPMGWVPLELLRQFPGGSSVGPDGLTVYGRLASGRTIEQANAEVRAISANLDRAYPQQASSGGPVARNWSVVPSVDMLRSFAGQAWSLVALIGLVLAVACTNLANLVLARGSAHQHELAVRQALGASRRQLVLELCAESVWLAMAAGALALGVTRVLLVAVVAQLPPGQRFNISTALSPDVLAAAGIALVVSVAVFGLWPALQLTRRDVRTALVADAGTGGAIRWRTRRWLIVAQVAIAAAFVTVAATCVRAALTTAVAQTGSFDLDHLATVRLSFNDTGWSEGRSQMAVRQLTTLLHADPRIRAAAITTGVPISATWPAQLAAPDMPFPSEQDSRPTVGLISTTPELFGVLGLNVIRGRAFAEQDAAGTGPVALISETTAGEMLGTPTRSAVRCGTEPGCRVRDHGRQPVSQSSASSLTRSPIPATTEDGRFTFLSRSGSCRT